MVFILVLLCVGHLLDWMIQRPNVEEDLSSIYISYSESARLAMSQPIPSEGG